LRANQVQSQTQLQNQTGKAKTLMYGYDPEGRTLEMHAETFGEASTRVSDHYDSPGEAVAWTSEEGGSQWTRNVPGLDGSLCAIREGTGKLVLQLHDLHGDVVETASMSEAEAQPESKYRSTEFGVPTASSPPKYSWLGAAGVATELSSGVIAEGGTSYVPQVARTLQSEAVDPPGLPEGSGPLVPYTFHAEAWNGQGAQRAADEGIGSWAAEEREAAEAAESGADPEEPEPEVELVDPEGLASYKRTLKRAGELRSAATNTRIFSAFCALAGEAAPVCSFGAEAWATGLDVSAGELEFCASFKKLKGRQWKWGVCYIHEFRAEFGIFSLPVFARATPCEYKYTHRWLGKKTNWYHCLGEDAWREGPWF
jgi:hypothetical protein